MNNPNAYPPLGIVHLGTELRDKGEEVVLHDMTWDRDYEPVREVIERVKPEFVGLSTLSIAYQVSQRVAEIAEEFQVGSIVLGGAHACTRPVGWRYEVVPGPYDFRPDLIPDRSLLPTFRHYLKQNPGFPYLMPWTYIIASRGCPFNCSFCQPMLRKLWGRRTVHRTVDSVYTEIENLVREYGLASYTFMDDTMISDEIWLTALCGRLKGIGRPWTCQTNVRTVTWDKLRMMKEAGCYFIGFGVETGSEWINKFVYNKPQTNKQVRQVFEMCGKLDILTEATLIIGAPEDTEFTINQTAELIKEVSPDVIDLHVLTPTPGSSLFDKYTREGKFKNSDARFSNRYTFGVLQCELDEREIRRGYWKIVRSWLEGKSVWRTKAAWGGWFGSLRGVFTKVEGMVRWVIYHNYFWHRVLKEGVWLGRRLGNRWFGW